MANRRTLVFVGNRMCPNEKCRLHLNVDRTHAIIWFQFADVVKRLFPSSHCRPFAQPFCAPRSITYERVTCSDLLSTFLVPQIESLVRSVGERFLVHRHR